jgi:tetrahydromethanopterin S-methyltransferase subunit G
VRLTGINPALPQVMARLDDLEEHFEKMNGNYATLKNYLGRFLTVV